jgi:mercuric ion transport protein
MRRHEATAVAGVGVAACAACCAGPILALLAAVGLGTVVGVAAFGAIGLIVMVLAVPVVQRHRRQTGRRRRVGSLSPR